MIPAFALAATVALTSAQVDSVMANAEKALSAYVFPEFGDKAAAMLKAKTPQYEEITNPKALRITVNRDLFAVTHDKHVGLWYPFNPEDAPSDHSAAAKSAQHEGELKNNFGFVSVRRLPGDVGYVDFEYFSGDPEVARAVQATMMFVASTDALIIDLRHNMGGNPIAAETLEGYFFDSQQPITSMMLRNPKTAITTEIQQYTAPTVPGPLYVGKPIYVLTSAHAFSCAEQFTYDLHNLKRITIVGETTGGGANPGDPHNLGHSFAIFIPEGRAYSPVTKTNWEGTGIAPDVPVAEANALPKAYGLALRYVLMHDKNAGVHDEATQAIADPQKALLSQP